MKKYSSKRRIFKTLCRIYNCKLSFDFTSMFTNKLCLKRKKCRNKMDKKNLATKKLFEKLNREMPKLAKLAMLDIQGHLDESNERQKNAKKIIQSKIYY